MLPPFWTPVFYSNYLTFPCSEVTGPLINSPLYLRIMTFLGVPCSTIIWCINWVSKCLQFENVGKREITLNGVLRLQFSLLVIYNYLAQEHVKTCILWLDPALWMRNLGRKHVQGSQSGREEVRERDKMMLESGGVETKKPRKRRLQELFYLSLIVCLSQS